MTRFFEGTGQFFEEIVIPMAEFMGRFVNGSFIILGFVGLIGWMLWEQKNRTEPNSDY
jgi:hypothetical protein